MQSSRFVRVCILLVGLIAAGLSPVLAGTMSTTWNPVTDTDLKGYHVYYGPTQGSHQSMQDAGNTTSTTLTVSDCQVTYSAVRAYDTGGLESSSDSNSVRGFPRPTITSLSSNTIKQGETKTITITGNNFDAGVTGDATRPPARVATGNSGLTVTSTTVNACGQITVTIQASTTAATGYTWLEVQNPDITYTDPANHPWVYGHMDNAINVTSATSGPTVTSANPAAGATNVATTVKPTVTFSTNMLASSVTSSTVQLLDSGNVAVAQAAGSPSTSGAVVTITPAAALGAGKTYHILVKGGSAGVKDTSSNPMSADWNQSPGWTTATSSSAPTVTSATPAAGATNVPTTVQPTITFSTNMLASSITTKTIQVRDPNNMAMAQAAGSPALNGNVVTVTLASPLTVGKVYHLFVQGGSTGVLDTNSKPMTTDWNQSPGWTVGSSSAPTVSSASPAAGATNVATTVKPTVTFSTNMLASSVTSSTVQLLDSGNVAVAQAAGSPSTSGNVVTITPAAALGAGKTYHILVKGGSAGVKDTSNNAMTSDWNQSPGWTTASSNSTPVTITGWFPAAGAQKVAYTNRTVKIYYNRDISTLWKSMTIAELQSTFRVTRLGNKLTQTSTSPTTTDGGMTVVITLAGNTNPNQTYRTEQGPLMQKGLDALKAAGIPAGDLAYLKYTSPGWTTGTNSTMSAQSQPLAPTTSGLTSLAPSTTSLDGSSTSATRSSGSTAIPAPQDLVIPTDAKTVPAQNANVPVRTEFVLTFSQPVVNGQALAGYFRITAADGTSVRLAHAPTLSNGNRSVTLTPDQSLDPGRLYHIVVRPGLKLVDGSRSSAADIPLATQVSGQSQNTSLAVAP